MGVRALCYRNGALHLIDQRRLPGALRILRLTRVRQVADAIRTMVVRGAPSIGVAAAYGMVLASRDRRWTPQAAGDLLRSTRPTAHDLFVGIDRIERAWSSGGDPLAAAEQYRGEIVGECHAIGDAGAPLLKGKERVLTHCNAGALATVEWGTALAPIRVAWSAGQRLFVWVDETRPLLQGSRLTAWELARERIPHAVIADNAAGHFMRTGGVDAVLVGADRIARNGDFANKIGTYEKAVVAHENGIPFYVAAPWSTFDLGATGADAIPVEERSDQEVRTFGGRAIMPPRSPARNPAFDVTPARYVSGYVTPSGVLRAAEIADRVPRGSETAGRRASAASEASNRAFK